MLTPAEVLTSAGSAGAVAAHASSVAGVYTAVAPSTPDYAHGGTAIVSVLPVTESSGPAGQAVIAGLAHALVGAPGVIGVGGDGATLIDFDHAVYGDFPLMLALIAVATFLLLTRAFRSVLLAAKAVVFNLISLAAAYGVLTWVFQDGHGSMAIFGVPATGAITMWVPLMVFAFLFGLSMDYEVFILSRIREAYDRPGPRGRPSFGPRADRPAGHQRGGDPDAQLRVDVHLLDDRPQDPRDRARRRDPGGRRGGALPAGPRDGGAVRPGELVAAGAAGRVLRVPASASVPASVPAGSVRRLRRLRPRSRDPGAPLPVS